MAITLYFLSGFNNYYNRTIKMPDETNVSAYSDYIIKTDEVEKFNPNDGVMTTLTLNYWDPPYDIDDAYDVDYLLVSLTNPQKIDSKWFVLDRRRKAEQQWELTIRRDLVSDNYNDVITAPCFIEKATLDAGSPFLFNPENMAFNQIKQEETLLNDGTRCPWIVGYYARNTADDFLHGVVDGNDLDASFDYQIDTSFSSWKYNATINPFIGSFEEIEYRIYAKKLAPSIGFQSQQGYMRFDENGNYNSYQWIYGLNAPLDADFQGYSAGAELSVLFKQNMTTLKNSLLNYVEGVNTAKEANTFLNFNGKTIKDADGRYFAIAIYQNEYSEQTADISAGSLFNSLSAMVQQNTYITGTPDTNSFKVYVKCPKYKMIATELFNQEMSWDMRGEKLITEDAPYNIFAIPCGTTQLEYGGYAVATSNKSIALATANSIIKTMESNLYDIQLLPYCPISTHNDDVEGGSPLVWIYDTKGFSRVVSPTGTDLEKYPCYILNVPKANFSKNLAYTFDAPTDAIETKVSNECEKYRLCSPNFNGYFDFSVAKNGGVDYFNVDCQYKPYQPYIHINPNFKGMYGQDFNDARGLICNGDFSLTQINDQWQSYQINNKNYQEIFSRQIENMEATRDIQRTQDIWGALAGTVGATASGVGAGMMFGGPPGAMIGGAIGGVSSAIGGAVDYSMSEKLHNMSLDYTKDMFGYNLSNIRALPYTLTKVSSLNDNNKLFPFVERYSATDEEKEAFRKKLQYNGMSVGVIDNIANYLTAEPSYIKGSIIRIDGNQQLDYHSLSELSNEIYKGVFI